MKAERQIWNGMRQRCGNPNHPSYHRYGGRGIKVCERWQTFGNFYADMGPRPSLEHSIDRVDNDGSYEPGNCRWATQLEQMQNTRRIRSPGEHGGWIYDCRMLLGWSLKRLAKESGLSLQTVRRAETDTSDWLQSTTNKIDRAVRSGGVIFVEGWPMLRALPPPRPASIDGTETEGPGVRLREPQR